MQSFVKNRLIYSLRGKLILSFLAFSIIPLAAVVTVAFSQFQEALRLQTSNQLTVVRDLKTKQVETYLRQIEQDIRLVAELPYVKTAVQQLEIGVRGLGLNQVRQMGFLGRPDLFYLQAYNPYAVYHAKYHAFFRELVQTKGYEDIWLVSPEGDIVYTFAKMDDFATNLFEVRYRDTLPVQLLRNLLASTESGQMQMTDYGPYPPAGDTPVSFIGSPIFDEDNIIGCLIYELSLDQMNDLMQVRTGFWKTGETYLVGADYLLRTRTRSGGQINFFEQTVDTLAVQKGLLGENGVGIIQNYRGVAVLSAYRALNVNRFKWILLAEVEKSEAFGPSNHLRHVMLIIIFTTTLIVIGAGLTIGRSIAKPITELAETSTQIASGDLELRAKSGTRDEIGHLAEAFNSMTGQLSELIGSLEQQIAERKQAEKELEKHRQHLEALVDERTAELTVAKEQAEKANVSKSDFLARMSHEIRTPLNAVTGLTNIVLKSELTAKQRDYLRKVQIASKNLLEVINDILDFSKVEAGRLELTHAPFNLNQVLELLADLFSDRVAQKNLELNFSIAPQVPRQLIGDAGRLTQVLTNLIENAIKFTETGEIVVGVEPDDKTVGHTGQTVLKFHVTDTGTGITANVRPTLFEPFTQAEGYLTRKHQGTGLGLAICRRLVQLMGGRIWVESTPGKGSTFSFTAMLETGMDRPETVTPRRAQAPAVLCLSGRRVLVVEDSELNRDVAVALLEEAGLTVDTAVNGREAVDKVTELPKGFYDAVLMDIQMPVMDGYEATRHIREWEGQQPETTKQSRIPSPQTGKPETNIPIIALTAHALKGEKEKCLAADMDDYLAKPLDEQDLHRVLLKWIATKQEDVNISNR